jgi:hypothetical protein
MFVSTQNRFEPELNHQLHDNSTKRAAKNAQKWINPDNHSGGIPLADDYGDIRCDAGARKQHRHYAQLHVPPRFQAAAEIQPEFSVVDMVPLEGAAEPDIGLIL